MDDPGARTAVDADRTVELHRIMPLCGLLGAEAVTVGPGEVRLRLAWSPERCTSGGMLHGGAVMALADAAGAWGAFCNLAPGQRTSTIESKTNFLRAVRTGSVDAVARPLHVGRTTVVMETEVTDDAGRLVAKVTQTQAVLGPPSA